MTALKKILTMMLFLCCMVTIFCYIGFRLGYDGLILIGEVAMPWWLIESLSWLFFWIQISLYFGYTLEIYNFKKLFFISVPYLLFSIIVFKFLSGILITLVLPNIYLFGFILRKELIKKYLINIAIWNSIILGYQAISLAIKIINFNFLLGAESMTNYEWLLWSIDLMILNIILYMNGGVKYYEKTFRSNYARSWQLWLCPENIDTIEYDYEDDLALKAWKNLQGFKKLKAALLWLGFHAIQWALILAACKLGNVFIEGLVISTSFLVTGMIIKRRWHSNNLLVCTLVSILMFYIAAKVTIDFYYSQLFSILIGLLLVYTLYRLSILVDNQEKNKNTELLNNLKQLNKKVNQAWEKIDKISDLL